MVFQPPVINQVDERYRSAYDHDIIIAQKEKEVRIDRNELLTINVLFSVEASGRSIEKNRTRKQQSNRIIK